ncbi:MAG: hypothetical protein C0594_09885, partial [Marinilabiliales bacterium]
MDIGKKNSSLLDEAISIMFTEKDKALEKCNLYIDSESNQDSIAHANNIIGNIHFYYDEYDLAMKHYLESLQAYEKSGNKKGMANVYNHIGNVKSVQALFEDAIRYYRQNQVICFEFEDSAGLSGVYNNIGAIMQEKEDYDSALYYYKLSGQYDLNQSIFLLGLRSANIGDCYLSTGDFIQALKYHLKSIEYKKQINDMGGIAQSYLSMSQIYKKMDSLEVCRNYLLEALDISRKNNARTQESKALEYLHELFYSLKDYQKAYTTCLEYLVVRDSIMSPKKADRIKTIESDYYVEKEKEIADLERSKQEVLYIFILSISVAVLLILILLFYLQRAKSKRVKMQKEKLELESIHLENQLEIKNRELAINVMYMIKKNELVA